MLLIQTALEQEFRAVVSVLHHAGQSPSPAGILCRYGRIGPRECCVVKTGVGLTAARQVLSEVLENIERPQAVLSIGLAGALAAELHTGHKRLVSHVTLTGREPCRLDAALNLLSAKYCQSVPPAALVSLDRPALSAQAKAHLHQTSSASLCDMETHAVARLAAARGVPWLGARIVIDSARESLPPWILLLPGLVRRRARGQLAWQLVTHPQDLPGLLRLAVRLQRLERQLAQFTAELVSNVIQS